MLDEYAEKYQLQEQDWRKQKPWYKPVEESPQQETLKIRQEINKIPD